MFKRLKFKESAGFTLIETLVGMAIFAIVATSIYFSYSNILNTIIISQFNLTALTILDNEAESVRNMPYEDIGIQGGVPSGKLLAEKSVIQDRASFIVRTTVRSVDDPFDGTIGGTPKDLAPADYKLVELELSCGACQFAPVRLTTTAAPKNLEGATNNGALFINVFDAFGNAVSDANVLIVNNSVSPKITINDSTNINGLLQLVDTATSSAGYEIAVTKNGYSADRTYPWGGAGNPNPVKPHASVAKQEVTAISFAIDKVSAVNFKTTDQLCVSVANVDFLQTGTKLIGTDPNVLKYSLATSTDAAGRKLLSGLEWDTYNFQNTDTNYDVSGTFTLTPVALNPAATLSFNWLMENKNPLAVLTTVRDQNGQSVNDAKVTLSKIGFSQSLYTGQRVWSVTDWSAGGYASKSSNLEVDNPAGEMHLRSIGSKYASASEEWLVSSTINFGISDAVFYGLLWTPPAQPPSSGPQSLKIQLASNNDDATWNFVGPDGTANTYYTLSDTVINSVHNGQRYWRYKVFLKTDDEDFTPRLQDLSIQFRSGCVPGGQSFFRGLTSGAYTVTVEKSGFQTFTDSNFSVTQNWQEYRATINP